MMSIWPPVPWLSKVPTREDQDRTVSVFNVKQMCRNVFTDKLFSCYLMMIDLSYMENVVQL